MLRRKKINEYVPEIPKQNVYIQEDVCACTVTVTVTVTISTVVFVVIDRGWAVSDCFATIFYGDYKGVEIP
jgi:hypothetical protein